MDLIVSGLMLHRNYTSRHNFLMRDQQGGILWDENIEKSAEAEHLKHFFLSIILKCKTGVQGGGQGHLKWRET